MVRNNFATYPYGPTAIVDRSHQSDYHCCFKKIEIMTGTKLWAYFNIIVYLMVGAFMISQHWTFTFALIYALIAPVMVLIAVHKENFDILNGAILLEVAEAFCAIVFLTVTAILGFCGYDCYNLFKYRIMSKTTAIDFGWLLLLVYSIMWIWKICVYLSCYKFIKYRRHVQAIPSVQSNFVA